MAGVRVIGQPAVEGDGMGWDGMAHRVLETCKARIVPVIDLTFVIDQREKLVVV
jgi:hypothetical protein